MIFFSGCAAVGYAKSKREVVALVQHVVVAKGIEKAIVTDGWWTSFKKRHRHMTLCTAEKLSYSRAVSCSPDILDHYYDLLEQTLSDNDLLDKPYQIFNLDETGIPLDPSPPKVVVPKGTKHPSFITTGNRAQITVLSCCNAAGSAMPPMVIFDRIILKPELTSGEIPGTIYGLSKNGWSDSELFHL